MANDAKKKTGSAGVRKETHGGTAGSAAGSAGVRKKTHGGTAGSAAGRGREGLTLLGAGRTAYPDRYDPGILEKFANRHPDLDTMVSLRCPEFTTLCPITGQPDFGELRIRYVPDKWLVESKSLKLYLFSFRNHGDFHEDVCNVVLKDLRALLVPKYLEVAGLFRPRGGIAIRPFVAWAPPRGAYAALAVSARAAFDAAGAPEATCG